MKEKKMDIKTLQKKYDNKIKRLRKNKGRKIWKKISPFINKKEIINIYEEIRL